MQEVMKDATFISHHTPTHDSDLMLLLFLFKKRFWQINYESGNMTGAFLNVYTWLKLFKHALFVAKALLCLTSTFNFDEVTVVIVSLYSLHANTQFIVEDACENKGEGIFCMSKCGLRLFHGL